MGLRPPGRDEEDRLPVWMQDLLGDHLPDRTPLCEEVVESWQGQKGIPATAYNSARQADPNMGDLNYLL